MSTELQHVESHWNSTVIPSILEQYKDSEKWQSFLKAVIDELQICEDAANELSTMLDFMSETPTGYKLDWMAGLVNVTRMSGESDTSLFTRFVLSLGNRNSGTPDFVIMSAAILSGDSEPKYMDEAPATFLVYDGPAYRTVNGVKQWTQGGHQLTRMQVRKTAPAGVLGLPCCAIGLDDGTVLGTYEENEEDRQIFLVAADDSTVEREVLLADNLGNIVVTSQSVPVRVKLQGSEVPNIPTIETEWNGVPVDAVRIKDLPDAELDSAYMVRDSDVGGTTKIDEDEVGIQMRPSGTNTLKFYRRGDTTP